jgi:AcrR family transcriptional regulator
MRTAEVKRSGRASALSADERRLAIVRATLPLLIERGEMVTTRQIAEAAGIAEGTIFRVFADKDELVAALIDHAVDPEPMEAALATLDPALPLETVLTGAVELLQRRTIDTWRLMAAVGPKFHDRVRRPMTDSPGLVALLDAHRDEIDLPPAEAARRLRAITLATSHPMLTEEPVPPAEITHQFLHGVGRRPSC